MACADDDGWENFSGKGCADYDLKWCIQGGFVPGAEWTGGKQFNFPEQHCCSCGKTSNGGGVNGSEGGGPSEVLLASDPRLLTSDAYASEMRDGALVFHRQFDPNFRCPIAIDLC